MLKEANLYDPTLTESEILDKAFKILNSGITSLFVAPYYLGKLRAILPKHISLSCPVDYPFGLGDTQMRQHGCIAAINRGANCIDLSVNPVYLLNKDKDKLIDDIQTNKKICHNRANLRIALDYRMFQDGLLYSVVSALTSLGIEYIIPSSGQFVDDFSDNLIMCQLLMNKHPGLKVICNNTFCTEEQLNTLIKSKIFGVRLKIL